MYVPALFEGLVGLKEGRNVSCKPVVSLMFAFAGQVAESLSLEQELSEIEGKQQTTALQLTLDKHRLALAELLEMRRARTLGWLGVMQNVLKTVLKETPAPAGEPRLSADRRFRVLSLLLDTLQRQVDAAAADNAIKFPKGAREIVATFYQHDESKAFYRRDDRMTDAMRKALESHFRN
jgi:hypothetical protein